MGDNLRWNDVLKVYRMWLMRGNLECGSAQPNFLFSKMVTTIHFCRIFREQWLYLEPIFSSIMFLKSLFLSRLPILRPLFSYVTSFETDNIGQSYSQVQYLQINTMSQVQYLQIKLYHMWMQYNIDNTVYNFFLTYLRFYFTYTTRKWRYMCKLEQGKIRSR